MSAILTKVICSILMSIMGLVVTRYISGSNEKILNLRNIFLGLLLIILPIILRNAEYNNLYTITIYGMTFVISKYFLNISYVRAAISSGIMIIALFVLDFIASMILASFITVEQLRNTWYINIISNFVFAIILISVFRNNKIRKIIVTFVDKLEEKKSVKIVIAIILTIVAMSTLLYILGNNFSLNSVFTTNFLIFIIFFLLIIMLLGERGNYDKLSDEYDGLISHVKIFEDWIENEQLNRHEFKNQLAVLRGMTKEKKVKDKIDKIISDNINIDNELVNQMKNLPSGGFKGLLYYKIALSRKYKIKFDIDVGNNVEEKLNSLNDKQLEVLTKLIGIYTDNAMEAAEETKKKLVSVEIYNLDGNINIVVTNSFNASSDIKDKNMKGISTKGKGRGNGLYFANKLVNKNNWLETNQEIIKNLYVERLIIKSK